MRDACIDAAAEQYNIPAGYVTFYGDGLPDPQTDGTFMSGGRADQGSDSVKQLRCLFNEAHGLTGVMTLDSDGE